MFALKKAIIVEDIDAWADKECKLLNSYLQNPADSTYLILNSREQKLNKITRYNYKNRAAVFYSLFEDKLQEWIRNKVKENNKTISADAVSLLINLCNTSLLEINNELSKLVIYTKDRQEITAEDIRQLTGDTKKYDIFQLIDAITSHNFPLSLKILVRLYESNEDVPSGSGKKESKGKDSRLYGFFSLLNSTIHQIYQIKFLVEQKKKNVQDLHKELGMHPFRLKKIMTHLKYYDFSRFDRMINILYGFDYKFKTSSVLKKEKLFKDLVYELCFD